MLESEVKELVIRWKEEMSMKRGREEKRENFKKKYLLFIFRFSFACC